MNAVFLGKIPPDGIRNGPPGYTYVFDGGFFAGHLTDFPEFTTQGGDQDDFVANLLDIYGMVMDGSLR